MDTDELLERYLDFATSTRYNVPDSHYMECIKINVLDQKCTQKRDEYIRSLHVNDTEELISIMAYGGGSDILIDYYFGVYQNSTYEDVTRILSHAINYYHVVENVLVSIASDMNGATLETFIHDILDDKKLFLYAIPVIVCCGDYTVFSKFIIISNLIESRSAEQMRYTMLKSKRYSGDRLDTVIKFFMESEHRMCCLQIMERFVGNSLAESPIPPHDYNDFYNVLGRIFRMSGMSINDGRMTGCLREHIDYLRTRDEV